MAQVNLDDTVNLLSITPIGSYNASATAVTVSTSDAAKLPAAPFNLIWWQISVYPLPAADPNVEIVRVTNVNLGTGVLTISRAAEGPTGASTKSGGGTYAMILGITEKMINDIQTGLNNTAFPGMSSTVPIGGNVVAGSFVQNDTTDNNDAVDITNAGTGNSLSIVNGATSAFVVNSSGNVGINNSTPTSTLSVNGSYASAYKAITASYAPGAADYFIDCTSGTFPVTLPDATTCHYRQYIIKNSGTGAITLGTTSSQTIDGTTSILLSTQWFYIMVESDGSNWKVLVYNNQAIATNFTGSDIGAQVNNAYAALPSAGGSILVPFGTYTYSTPIVFGTNGKIVSLIGSSAGATFMKYSPTTGNGVTVNFGNPTGHLVSEITGITFMGHSTLIAAGNANTATSVGIYLGGTQGCPGVNVHDCNINGFGTCLLIGANAYMLNIQNNSITGGNGGQASTGALVHINAASNSGERNVFSGNNFTDPGNSNANNAIYITAGATASNFFSSNSFDDAQVFIGGSNGQTTFIGNHIENAAYGVYGSYIPILGASSDLSTQITFIGNVIANDTSGTNSFSTIIKHGGQLYAASNNIQNYGNGTITNFIDHSLDNGLSSDYCVQLQVQGGGLTNIIAGSGGVSWSQSTGNAAVYNVGNSYTIGMKANSNNTNTIFSGNSTVASFDHNGDWTFGISGAGGTVTTYGKISKYNNISTAGWGVPTVYGNGRSTAQTAAVASVASYTVGTSDGSFLVSANVNVTTSTLHNFNVTVSYTDETNTAQVLTLNFSSLGGTFGTAITNTGGVSPYEGVPMHIRCKASTAITIATTGTFTTVTYNVEGMITQLA